MVSVCVLVSNVTRDFTAGTFCIELRLVGSEPELIRFQALGVGP